MTLIERGLSQCTTSIILARTDAHISWDYLEGLSCKLEGPNFTTQKHIYCALSCEDALV